VSNFLLILKRLCRGLAALATLLLVLVVVRVAAIVVVVVSAGAGAGGGFCTQTPSFAVSQV